MKTFTCLRLVINEIGRIMWVCFNFKAHDLAEAEKICIENGWRFDGELIAEIPAGPAENDFCNAVVTERDREWKEGGQRRIVRWD